MTAFGDEPADDDVAVASLQVLVTARADDDATFLALARWWLQDSRSRLCGDLWKRRASRDSEVEAVVGRIGVPSLGQGEWSVAHTDNRFERLMASLAERRGDAFWRITAVGGGMAVGDPVATHVSLTAEPDSDPWVFFAVDITYRTRADGAVPEASQRLLTDFVADFAEIGRATFANVATDNSAGRTALEALLPRQRRIGMAESPIRARGYSWLTIVAPDVLQRLGGVSGLQATGAFAEVRPLRYGGALLRATELMEEYDDDAMSQVFRAIAPALPPGRPRKLPAFAGPPTARLVYEDASEHPK